MNSSNSRFKLIDGEKKDCPHCDKAVGLDRIRICPYPENHRVNANGSPLTIEMLERGLFHLKYNANCVLIKK